MAELGVKPKLPVSKTDTLNPDALLASWWWDLSLPDFFWTKVSQITFLLGMPPNWCWAWFFLTWNTISQSCASHQSPPPLCVNSPRGEWAVFCHGPGKCRTPTSHLFLQKPRGLQSYHHFGSPFFDMVALGMSIKGLTFESFNSILERRKGKNPEPVSFGHF